MSDSDKAYHDLLASYGYIQIVSRISPNQYNQLPANERADYVLDTSPGAGSTYVKRKPIDNMSSDQARWFLERENFYNIKKTREYVGTIKGIAIFFLLAFLTNLAAVIYLISIVK